jgi:PilZ domain-containing protein
MKTSMEHRWGQRALADLPVMITCEGRQIGMGRVSNVSLSGALLVTPLKMPLYASVNVSPVGDESNAGIVGCVVRIVPGAFAVEWRDMASPPVIALIERISPEALRLDRRDTYAA